MFSFHKPKIYRSMQGCCICRAKSSSSRFTDSKRYENDFIKCFEILERRSGEICNACVLLVKRWKKLPADSNRNWRHVVDARAGPGTKSMNKIKNKAKMEEKMLKKKHKHKHKKPKTNKPNTGPVANCSSGGLSDDVADDFSENSSQSGSFSSDGSDDEASSSRILKTGFKDPKGSPLKCSAFLDSKYWKKTEVCCGIIFKGPQGAVAIDCNLFRPCKGCKPDPLISMFLPNPQAAKGPSLPSTSTSTSTQHKSETPDAKTPMAEESNDAVNVPYNNYDDDEIMDDDDDDDDVDDEIVGELDLDDDMIDGIELEDDEGAEDSGLGSQEISTAGGSPAQTDPPPPPVLQTAAAMLHAMSTGADLLPSEVSTTEKQPATDTTTTTSARARNCSGEQQQAAAASSSSSPSSLHSTAAAVVPSVVPAASPCIQIQMAV